MKRVGDERRRELPAPEALLLIDEIETEYNSRFIPDQDTPSRAQANAFYNEMAADRPSLKLTGRPGKTLERILLKKQEYKLRAEFLDLGKNRQGRSKGKRVRQKVANLRHAPSNMGVRKKGGGRKNRFEEFLQLVKIYTDVERLRGHHLEADDVFREFMDQLEKRMELYSFKRKYGELSPSEGYKFSMLEDRYEKLNAPTRYKESYTKTLVAYCQLAA